MAEEEFDEFEGEPVLGTRLICRGLEGGLRETVAVSDPAFYTKGERITLVVDAIVDHVAFPSRKPIDEDDDEEGMDRLHVTKLVTVAIIDREAVAAQLDAQAQRIAVAHETREQAKVEAKARRKAERAAERERAKTAGTLFEKAPTEDDDDSDLTDAERKAKAAFAA